MILQALTKYYEDLLALGVISRPGWGQAKVSYGLELDDNGTLLGLLPLQTEQVRGSKTVMAPRSMEVPMPVKRSSGVSANFLCDNGGYLLGADDKGKPQRTAECYAACQKLHRELLAEARSPAAKAVLAYFENWDPEQAAGHPALAGNWEDVNKGANLIFWYQDGPVSDDPEIRERWQSRYDQKGEEPMVRCLVTGEMASPQEVHPAIKGVLGAQTSGAALVSFNAPSFWSYGHEYGANAPVGSYAAFAYTTALNHLLSDRDHVQHIGDTTVLCWAEGGQAGYQDLGMAALYGDTVSEQDIQSALGKLARGEQVTWNDDTLNPGTRFYVLGLAPNAARLSVRFFWRNTFQVLVTNVTKHYNRLRIQRPSFDKVENLDIRRLLQETVNQNARSPSPVPQMAGDVLYAVLTDGPYPATLLSNVTLRIRAEREVTRGRAAIIKAYYSQNQNEKCPEEVLDMQLNLHCDYPPYVLGRLFSVLETVQSEAVPGINATIKDKYFNSASATPAVVFPQLINLAQNHLRKLEVGKQVYFDKQISDLLAKITETYPARLTLPEQGAFQLGYYHQRQQHFTKKEEKQNV